MTAERRYAVRALGASVSPSLYFVVDTSTGKPLASFHDERLAKEYVDGFATGWAEPIGDEFARYVVPPPYYGESAILHYLVDCAIGGPVASFREREKAIEEARKANSAEHGLLGVYRILGSTY